jgi:protein-tyrosine phosphatase
MHRAGAEGLEVASAGTRAVLGSGVHPLTGAALERRGIDSAGHTAQDLTARLVREADVVLAMTRAHRSAVVRIEPSAVRHTFTLAEASRLCMASTELSPTLEGWVERLASGRHAAATPADDDILDPIGMPGEGHDAAVSRIADCVDRVLSSWPVRLD